MSFPASLCIVNGNNHTIWYDYRFYLNDDWDNGLDLAMQIAGGAKSFSEIIERADSHKDVRSEAFTSKQKRNTTLSEMDQQWVITLTKVKNVVTINISGEHTFRSKKIVDITLQHFC